MERIYIYKDNMKRMDYKALFVIKRTVKWLNKWVLSLIIRLCLNKILKSLLENLSVGSTFSIKCILILAVMINILLRYFTSSNRVLFLFPAHFLQEIAFPFRYWLATMPIIYVRRTNRILKSWDCWSCTVIGCW